MSIIRTRRLHAVGYYVGSSRATSGAAEMNCCAQACELVRQTLQLHYTHTQADEEGWYCAEN